MVGRFGCSDYARCAHISVSEHYCCIASPMFTTEPLGTSRSDVMKCRSRLSTQMRKMNTKQSKHDASPASGGYGEDEAWRFRTSSRQIVMDRVWVKPGSWEVDNGARSLAAARRTKTVGSKQGSNPCKQPPKYQPHLKPT